MDKLNEYLQTLVSSSSSELHLEPNKIPYLLSSNGTNEVANAPIMGPQISTMIFPLIPAEVKMQLPNRSEVEFSYSDNLGDFSFIVRKSPAGFNVTIRPVAALQESEAVEETLQPHTFEEAPVFEQVSSPTEPAYAQEVPAPASPTLDLIASLQSNKPVQAFENDVVEDEETHMSRAFEEEVSAAAYTDASVYELVEADAVTVDESENVHFDSESTAGLEDLDSEVQAASAPAETTMAIPSPFAYGMGTPVSAPVETLQSHQSVIQDSAEEDLADFDVVSAAPAEAVDHSEAAQESWNDKETPNNGFEFTAPEEKNVEEDADRSAPLAREAATEELVAAPEAEPEVELQAAQPVVESSQEVIDQVSQDIKENSPNMVSPEKEVLPVVPLHAALQAGALASVPFNYVSEQPAFVPAKADAAAAARMDDLFEKMAAAGASDLHLSVSMPPMIRKDGRMQPLANGESALDSAEMEKLLTSIMPAKNQEEFARRKDTDFAYELAGLGRFRANIFMDRKGMGGVFRIIPSKMLTADDLGLSSAIMDLCNLSKGLVVVTGPTGSGKSTTLSAMVNHINESREDHIITIEDPIEFVHDNKKCLVNQREVHNHTDSFKDALRAALREDPDILLVGEMRDLETISIAIETAETGHLVFGTLHTTTAASTIDRIIDQFPADRQQQIRVMLSESLRGVIAQTLLPKKGGGRVAALEVLIVTPAISNLIREGKTFQIASAMQTGKAQGMVMLNDALMDLVKSGVVEPKDAYVKAVDKRGFETMLTRNGFSV